jgi:hypothetical protein
MSEMRCSGVKSAPVAALREFDSQVTLDLAPEPPQAAIRVSRTISLMNGPPRACDIGTK